MILSRIAFSRRAEAISRLSLRKDSSTEGMSVFKLTVLMEHLFQKITRTSARLRILEGLSHNENGAAYRGAAQFSKDSYCTFTLISSRYIYVKSPNPSW